VTIAGSSKIGGFGATPISDGVGITSDIGAELDVGAA
jgi:hypothetical protein